MREMHVDIETFSWENLKTAGLHRYSKKSEILMITVAYDDFPLRFKDVYSEGFPEWIKRDLQDPTIIKVAHNAPFEIEELSFCLDIELDPAQWVCTMVLCAMAGLPMGLGEAVEVLGLSEGKSKSGTALINLFSKPCKPTKANGYRTRNLPEHFPGKWQQYCAYNRQDVRAERALHRELRFIRVPDFERVVWALDQKINRRGIRINQTFVNNAIVLDTVFRERVINEAKAITGLTNPKSVKQLKEWLEEETDTEIENLQKKEIPKLIAKFDSQIVKRVLTIRQELSKTSVSKFKTMLNAVLENGRINGMFQYCGAGRTWRFAGRLLQVHNIVKGKFKYYKDIDFDDLDFARSLVLKGDAEMLELLYGAIPDTLSQLIRTAIVPSKGKRFIVSDFSAIEARIIAWLAGEEWRLEVFRTHGKIYEASAAIILRKPIEEVTSEERSKIGKVTELALGYAGGVNAMIKMGALEAGLLEHELQPLVTKWREASPAIKQLWYDVDRAAKRAITSGEKITIQKGISFLYRRKYLIIGLPSGHSLYYYNASLIPGEFGVQIQYYGLDQVKKKWVRQRTYGGKLVENICQAIGRDCLVNAMVNLDRAGYSVCMHVHDEVVCEELLDFGSLEEVNELMCKKAPWMHGLPLKAAGFYGKYYKKD